MSMTGDPAVDQVVSALGELDSAPVHAHVAAFEDALERLRGVLADAGDQNPGC